ncbi:MAG: hypothetical protein ACYC1U_09110 [Candidatus Aquicultorales bacterium]
MAYKERRRHIRKTRKMRQVEAAFGRPIETVLEELYKTNTFEGVSSQLGKIGVDVSLGTLSLWFLKLDLPTRRWLIPEKGDHQRDGGADGGEMDKRRAGFSLGGGTDENV